jgi:hypothetical protein
MENLSSTEKEFGGEDIKKRFMQSMVVQQEALGIPSMAFLCILD